MKTRFLIVVLCIALALAACVYVQNTPAVVEATVVAATATQTQTPAIPTATAMPTRTPIPPTPTRTPLPPCAIHPMPPEATIHGPALVYLMGYYSGKTQVIKHFVKAGESITPISGTNVDYCAATGPDNISLIRRLEIIKE
jgi:hypothetical protein